MPSAHPLTDHDDIRAWAESRRAHPACVRRTGGKGDPGMIRLDFPGYSGRQSLSPISWKEWFDAFDENNLALLVQDETSRGQRSNFNKLVSRRSVSGARKSRGRRRSSASSRARSSSSRPRRAAGRKRSSSSRARRAAAGGRKRKTSSRSARSR